MIENGIKVKINGEEFNVKKSYRGLMMFEELTGKGISEMKESATDLLTLFYCLLKASNKEKFTKTFDDFIDIIDENPDSVDVFNAYLLEEGKKNEKSSTKKKSENR